MKKHMIYMWEQNGYNCWLLFNFCDNTSTSSFFTGKPSQKTIERHLKIIYLQWNLEHLYVYVSTLTVCSCVVLQNVVYLAEICSSVVMQNMNMNYLAEICLVDGMNACMFQAL